MANANIFDAEWFIAVKGRSVENHVNGLFPSNMSSVITSGRQMSIPFCPERLASQYSM
jgi:hypothetical protein